SAAFLRRAVALTPDPRRRGVRALAAAEASLQAGAFDAALRLLAAAEAGPLDEFSRARVDLVRADVAFASGPAGDAAWLLFRAAKRIEPFDIELARETYLTAWNAASVAGHLGGQVVLLEICHAVRALPPPSGAPRPVDLLLDGLALVITDGHAAAISSLQRASEAVSEISVADVLHWGWAARTASGLRWDFEGMLAISERQVQLVRDAGALALLPLQLFQLATVRIWMGDFAGARSLIAESDSVAAATGVRYPPYAELRVMALEGREAEAVARIASAIERAASDGEGMADAYGRWATAVLFNGLGRYEVAAAAARQATSDPLNPWMSMFALPELVEAAVRTGDVALARKGFERLEKTTEPCDTNFARGIEARCRALLSDGPDAEALFREAIDRLQRSQLRPDLGRAHLLYGEWLRREARRIDARQHLRTAYEMFHAIGMEAFAERARRELLATGETVRKRTVETLDDLTPQEVQIARLASDGRTNPEIGAQLFLSPRTVEWHLRKVFAKLGVASRRELRAAMPEATRTAVGVYRLRSQPSELLVPH
ncbi:MAG TPA: LuxR C-terminal-related transcriptional regulator, partial [Candidatus Limnocylindrales bacterium]